MSAKHERVARKVRGGVDLDMTLADLDRIKGGVTIVDGIAYIELIDGRIKRYRSAREMLGPKGLVWNGTNFTLETL